MSCRRSCASRYRSRSRSWGWSFFSSFVANWNNFFLPYAILADERQLPVQVGLSDIFRSTRLAVALAALIAARPVAIAFVFSHRALARGALGSFARG
jgi:multiple sugar transport system permease protein